MKDLLADRIKAEVKVQELHLLQSYLIQQMDYSVYKDLVTKLHTNKKKLLVLIDDTGDLTVRNRIETQLYPYRYYVKNIMQPEDE